MSCPSRTVIIHPRKVVVVVVDMEQNRADRPGALSPTD